MPIPKAASGLRLFYSPGACSLAAHIALEETGASFEAIRVDFSANEQRSPEYLAINPKGRVPALIDDGIVITENPAILRYIVRKFPEPALWPSEIEADARCAEWLAWISSGVHVMYSHTTRPERYVDHAIAREWVSEKGAEHTRENWKSIERQLSPGRWAMGSEFTVVDPYLVTIWTWARKSPFGLDLERDLPNWCAHARRMGERLAVRRAFEREGLPLPA